MTTNEKLIPGTLIEYKSAHSIEKAWVLEPAVPAITPGLVRIRVKGETGINTDLEFDLHVKARGRAKVLELPKTTVDDCLDALAGVNMPTPGVDDFKSTPRATGSHANCSHPATKAGRAACRKARAHS